MARVRFRLSAFSFFAVLGLIILGAFTLCAAATSASSPRESAPSPSADTDLICHTDKLSECYPRIFQPTDEFQPVKDDQEIPPGLHVRINVSTGKKEAKINVPDEVNTALDGLPVDSSVVVVEPEAAEEAVRLPKGAPAYEEVGKIKPPAQESKAFHKSLKILRKGLDFDEALEDLEDISHDIYYGLKIAEDYDTVKALFCLANSPDIYDKAATDSTLSRARLAALVIAGAVQNNAKALAEIESHWQALKNVRCTTASEPLGTATFRLIAPVAEPATLRNSPSLAKARAAAVNGLIKSPVIRKDFLESGGMGFLLEALVSQTEAEWEPAQRKVALLVQDTFLDENMGATLGEWPRDDQAGDEECKRGANGVSERCWDWEAKKLAQLHKSDKSHWSRELWSRLKEARKLVKTKPSQRVEL